VPRQVYIDDPYQVGIENEIKTALFTDQEQSRAKNRRPGNLELRQEAR
jgi:hypothetical protein